MEKIRLEIGTVRNLAISGEDHHGAFTYRYDKKNHTPTEILIERGDRAKWEYVGESDAVTAIALMLRGDGKENQP